MTTTFILFTVAGVLFGPGMIIAISGMAGGAVLVTKAARGDFG